MLFVSIKKHESQGKPQIWQFEKCLIHANYEIPIKITQLSEVSIIKFIFLLAGYALDLSKYSHTKQTDRVELNR